MALTQKKWMQPTVRVVPLVVALSPFVSDVSLEFTQTLPSAPSILTSAGSGIFCEQNKRHF